MCSQALNMPGMTLPPPRIPAGQGEYQLFSAPEMAADVHYFGCGVTKGDSTGTYMGAIAVNIGSVSIEIVANDLSVVGGATYDVDYNNDKAVCICL